MYLTDSLSGTYAQYSLVAEDSLQLLPEKLSFDQGASVAIPYKTAFLALKRTQARASQTLLVHGGSGAVGLAAIQMARAKGLVVIASAGTEEGLALVRRNGAHHGVDLIVF